jgi:hypothetical protein
MTYSTPEWRHATSGARIKAWGIRCADLRPSSFVGGFSRDDSIGNLNSLTDAKLITSSRSFTKKLSGSVVINSTGCALASLVSDCGC